MATGPSKPRPAPSKPPSEFDGVTDILSLKNFWKTFKKYCLIVGIIWLSAFMISGVILASYAMFHVWALILAGA